MYFPKNWLNNFGLSLVILLAVQADLANAQSTAPDPVVLAISERLLDEVRSEENTAATESELQKLDVSRLVSALPNDQSRITFWVNQYNAWYQILAIRDKMKFPWIFRAARIPFKDFTLSLDDIEHGILRRYRKPYKIGSSPSGVQSAIVEQLAVEQPDMRIHFALNCGAKSCPPIAFYSYTDLDKQLNQAMTGFMESETRIDTKTKTVFVTRIMDWYSMDFGSKEEQLKLVGLVLNKDLAGFKIGYRAYNWTSKLRNFKSAAR